MRVMIWNPAMTDIAHQSLLQGKMVCCKSVQGCIMSAGRGPCSKDSLAAHQKKILRADLMVYLHDPISSSVMQN